MAREPDVALLMTGKLHKKTHLLVFLIKNMGCLWLLWLSQPKRFPTPALKSTLKAVRSAVSVAVHSAVFSLYIFYIFTAAFIFVVAHGNCPLWTVRAAWWRSTPRSLKDGAKCLLSSKQTDSWWGPDAVTNLKYQYKAQTQSWQKEIKTQIPDLNLDSVSLHFKSPEITLRISQKRWTWFLANTL